MLNNWPDFFSFIKKAVNTLVPFIMCYGVVVRNMKHFSGFLESCNPKQMASYLPRL